MTRHLAEEEIIAATLDEENGDATAHLESCAECARAVQGLRQELASFSKQAAELGERDEMFWMRQRASIRQRLAEPAPPPFAWQWGTALAALVILAAAVLISSGRSQPDVAAASGHPDEDRALLIQVEQNLSRQLPVALEPAGVLTTDMDNALRANLRGSSQDDNTNSNRNGGVL